MKKKLKITKKKVAKPIKKAPPKKVTKAKSEKKAPQKNAVPTRAPVKKIIGRESVVVPPRSVAASPSIPLQKAPVLPAVKVIPQVARPPKSSWRALPSNIPSRIRFLVSAAAKECEAASTWPLAFGKFIALLPNEVCGREFSFLLMSLEHSKENISALCRVTLQEVEDALHHVSETVEDLFSNHCGDMYRKWSGSRVSPELLIEPYLIGKLDKEFQILLAEAIIQGMRGENTSPRGFDVTNLSIN